MLQRGEKLLGASRDEVWRAVCQFDRRIHLHIECRLIAHASRDAYETAPDKILRAGSRWHEAARDEHVIETNHDRGALSALTDSVGAPKGLEYRFDDA
jgi:hypothetical protein